MIKVLKASAGSGKTYRLAHSYIDLMMASAEPHPYRHILAVTFTNKATSEMKARILRELSAKADSDPKAQKLLREILHDYSAFSVSTIDKFFQQALKAFSRELNIFSAYQIELDRDSLIQETVERILDSLTPDDREILDWIDSLAMEDLSEGKKFRLEQKLFDAAKLLKGVQFQECKERLAIDETEAFSIERITSVKKACDDVVRNFETALKLLDPAQFAKKKDLIEKPGVNYLKKAQPAVVALFDKPFREYKTAYTIRKQLSALGLARKFSTAFPALLKEKNVMSLDESNVLLKDIIAGSDAPFVYEKLGVRYEHFLLDEFQDTSNVQWDNFYPLLRESDSNANDNLIVGDVKQCIYRWRGSDWNLLDNRIALQFPRLEVEKLDCNWRSCETVVDFNNAFYTFAAPRIGLASIYDTVFQHKKSKETQKGSVKVTFVQDDDTLPEIVASVRAAFSGGARPGDIAILVRKNDEGAQIASFLMDNGINVISDDSLDVKSSAVVRRLVSLLSCIDNPKDAVSTFMASEMDAVLPSGYHSLVDLAESLLRILKDSDPESFDGETLYIQSFMDSLQDWSSSNGNNLLQFLSWWEGAKPMISSPADSNAVRIMTIHKSKGLEFPCLIFPYAESVGLYRHETKWCEPQLKGTALEGRAEGLYPVSLTKDVANTCFEDALSEEKRLQAVDNMNIFYVATTRAEKCLHIISELPSDTARKALDSGKSYEYKHISELLYSFCATRGNIFGEEYDFTKMERGASSGEADFAASYESIPLEGRLTAAEDAFDFFGDDGKVGSEASSRLSGIEMHDLLARANTASDLQSIGAPQMLVDRVNSHPEWFSEGIKAYNETPVYDSFGNVFRPDRVIVDGTSAVVIDYKFGSPLPSYARQVGRYMSLYRDLGYKEVSGYVWYVLEDRVDSV